MWRKQRPSTAYLCLSGGGDVRGDVALAKIERCDVKCDVSNNVVLPIAMEAAVMYLVT